MAAPTTPNIHEAQNTQDARRLVAAQARLYSDAKTVFATRIAVIVILAAGSAAVALSSPSLRTLVGAGGGALALIVSFVIGNVEKWIRFRAAATQERFDTEIFQLSWNNLHADRPPQHVIARAAQRYRGSRDRDWYSDTEGVHRPFDVLILQSSNLGWGARMHLLWAWSLVGFTVCAVGSIAAIWHFRSLTAADGIAALFVPALGPLKEAVEQIKLNFEAARSKETAERKVNEMWDRGMAGQHTATVEELRTIQDKILLLRQSNPYVPDWFDKVLHRGNEQAMHTTCSDRVTQARRQGHTS